MRKLNTQKQANTVLIAIMNNPKDFLIAKEQGWYRIPYGKQTTPLIVRDGTVKVIAFYHTSKFKNYKFSIRFMAEVQAISVVSRQVLFPNESASSTKASNEYYKLEIGPLMPLAKPIISKRHRRVLFIPTTKTKFETTQQLLLPEINYLYNDSPLEDLLYQKMLEHKIVAERQFYVHKKGQRWILDFAIHCRDKDINVECDGFKYHYATIEQKEYDNIRNNDLNSEGWHVLRYNTKQLNDSMDTTIQEIKKTIKKCGDLKYPIDGGINFSDGPQLRLF